MPPKASKTFTLEQLGGRFPRHLDQRCVTLPSLSSASWIIPPRPSQSQIGRSGSRPLEWSGATRIGRDYRVIICNCHFLYLFDRHLKTTKSYNPIIFVSLIYRHFDILRSHDGQVKISHAFPGCVKIVLWLHTAKAENSEHI